MQSHLTRTKVKPEAQIRGLLHSEDNIIKEYSMTYLFNGEQPMLRTQYWERIPNFPEADEVASPGQKAEWFHPVSPY